MLKSNGTAVIARGLCMPRGGRRQGQWVPQGWRRKGQWVPRLPVLWGRTALGGESSPNAHDAIQTTHRKVIRFVIVESCGKRKMKNAIIGQGAPFCKPEKSGSTASPFFNRTSRMFQHKGCKMNLLTLTDSTLAAFHRQTTNEIAPSQGHYERLRSCKHHSWKRNGKAGLIGRRCRKSFDSFHRPTQFRQDDASGRGSGIGPGQHI